jgi:hypothetical protein
MAVITVTTNVTNATNDKITMLSVDRHTNFKLRGLEQSAPMIMCFPSVVTSLTTLPGARGPEVGWKQTQLSGIPVDELPSLHVPNPEHTLRRAVGMKTRENEKNRKKQQQQVNTVETGLNKNIGEVSNCTARRHCTRKKICRHSPLPRSNTYIHTCETNKMNTGGMRL